MISFSKYNFLSVPSYVTFTGKNICSDSLYDRHQPHLPGTTSLKAPSLRWTADTSEIIIPSPQGKVVIGKELRKWRGGITMGRHTSCRWVNNSSMGTATHQALFTIPVWCHTEIAEYRATVTWVGATDGKSTQKTKTFPTAEAEYIYLDAKHFIPFCLVGHLQLIGVIL